ncbi:MAG: leucine-rich repeat domain-containing protein [Kiritimatiellaeota bacterium]|nr:leucine-rich repeat domain-containing protein [Kiritimatiellota bacterium]
MTHKTILAAFALASATLGAHAQSAPNSPHWQLSGASGDQTITHYTDATTPSGWKLEVTVSSGTVRIRTGADVGGVNTAPSGGGTLPLADTIYLASDFSQTRDLTRILSANTVDQAPFYAFRGEVTGVEFPSTLTQIGQNAFEEATNLAANITIPANVTRIGIGAFRYSGITGLAFEANSQLTTIDLQAFRHCNALTGNVEIPASVTVIGSYAFSPSAITGLTFESGSQLGRIASDTFRNTANLSAAVEIPASVTNIGPRAFMVSAVTEITFESGSSLEHIDSEAFRDCASLTAVTIPASVTGMGNPFVNCETLASVTFLGARPPAGVHVYEGVNSEGTIRDLTNPNLITYIYAEHLASWQSSETAFGIISADPDSATWQSRRIVCTDPENLPYYVIGFTDGKSVRQQVVEFADTGASFAPMPMRKGYSFHGWKDASNTIYLDGHSIGANHLATGGGEYVVLTALWSFDGGDEAWVPVTVTGFKVDGDGNAIITWNESELMTRLGAQSPDDCEYVIHYTDSLSDPVQWSQLDGGSLATPLWRSCNALIGLDEAPGANGSMFFKVQAIKK